MLPLFRKDLKIYRGPDDSDGSPTYSLLEPLKGQFYKLSWKESFIFRHLKPNMTAEDLKKEIESHSTLRISVEDIDKFFLQAQMLDLLRVPKSSEYLFAVKERSEQSWWTWILHHYLYLRIPLLNPDRFLSRTLPYVEFLGSKLALFIYILITLFGLGLVIGRLDEFFHTFFYFFNLEGVIIYALAITATKLIHEFSHAYVAKHYTLHVRSMGIAFIVLWPVLYTDVTDGWKLSRRSQRVAISFAGIAAELIIAGLATIGWAFTSPGTLHSVFFVLASLNWISTLALNLNPAVRFDGYYILSDLWGIDNLQARAFSVFRWQYLKTLFGVDAGAPEEGLSSRRTFWLSLYTVYVYVYRIFLYTAIALFVYHEFTKALGIILFIAEVLIFMVWPVWYEGAEAYKLRHQFHLNRRLLTSLALFTTLFLYAVIPWRHELVFDAVLLPAKEQLLWTPEDGLLLELHGARNKFVEKGEVLAKLTNATLRKDLAQAALARALVENKLFARTLSDVTSSGIGKEKAELAQLQEKEAGLKNLEALMTLKANISGTLTYWDDTLKVGQAISKGTVIGKIADTRSFLIRAFVPEIDSHALKVGQKVTVEILEPFKQFEGTLVGIAPFRTETLAYPNLASTHHGPLAVTQTSNKEAPALLESYYMVFIEAAPPSSPFRYGQRVQVRLQGPPRSYAMQLIRKITRVLTRESSL